MRHRRRERFEPGGLCMRWAAATDLQLHGDDARATDRQHVGPADAITLHRRPPAVEHGTTFATSRRPRCSRPERTCSWCRASSAIPRWQQRQASTATSGRPCCGAPQSVWTSCSAGRREPDGGMNGGIAPNQKALRFARRASFRVWKRGEPARIRTENLVIKSHLLCR